MTAFEKTITRDMTRDRFEKIRDHVYGDGKNTFEYTYGDVASWLVWNRNDKGEIAKVPPPSPIYTKRGNYYDGSINNWDDNTMPPERRFSSKLTADIVFLGLNMSGDGTPPSWPSFQNARGHKRIVKTFFNTSAEGAYFTDLIKPDKRFLNEMGRPSNSTEVVRTVNAQRNILKEHVRLFIEELDFIGAVKPLLIVFGAQAAWLLRQALDDSFIQKRFFAIVEIYHYASYPRGGDEGYITDTKRKLAPYLSIARNRLPPAALVEQV